MGADVKGGNVRVLWGTGVHEGDGEEGLSVVLCEYLGINGKVYL